MIKQRIITVGAIILKHELKKEFSAKCMIGGLVDLDPVDTKHVFDLLEKQIKFPFQTQAFFSEVTREGRRAEEELQVVVCN
jgi:hypothetical protein